MNQLAGGAKSFADRIQFNTDRDAYNYLLGKQNLPLGSKERINPNATITEGYLRSEVDLIQQNSIDFRIKENDGSVNVTERRLAISQMFLVTQMGLMLYNATASPTALIRAQSRLHTYPALEVNTGTNDVGAIYNSSIQARVDQVTYFDALDTMRFYRAGEAQQGVTPLATAVSDTWDSPNWGMYRLTPFIFLGGQSDNVLTLQLPANVDLTDNNATVVLFLRGLLIQNAYANNS